MSLFTSYVHFSIEGIMPERALLRLRRGGISLYRVRKTQKNRILLRVNAKDCEKVFAFYPNVCYNNRNQSPYIVKKIGVSGWIKYVELGETRVGLLLGGLLASIVLLFSTTFTFGVEIVGSDIYLREGKIALAEGGIKPFAPYKKGKEDWICAQMLALDGVEYCSIKKKGLYTRLEIRLSPFTENKTDRESMAAKHAGILRSLTVLKGTALKKAGEEIQEGDILVENAFYTQAGEQVCVEPIARAVIDCVFKKQIEADNEEAAFACAYLALNVTEEDGITSKEVVKVAERLFLVEIGYTVIEKINL